MILIISFSLCVFSIFVKLERRVTNVPSMVVRAVAKIDDDGLRYLIGDDRGGLHVLALTPLAAILISICLFKN